MFLFSPPGKEVNRTAPILEDHLDLEDPEPCLKVTVQLQAQVSGEAALKHIQTALLELGKGVLCPIRL